MHDGEYASTISALSVVFNTCKVLLASCHQSSPTKNDDVTGNRRSPIATSYCAFSSEVAQRTVVFEQQDGTDSPLFLCRQLLQLLEPHATGNHRVRRNLGTAADFAEVATYAIILNLALCCHHLQADRSSENGSFSTNTRRAKKSLKQAVALYSCARNALKLVLDRATCTDSVHVVVLLNNVVNDANQLLGGDDESERRCLQHLAKTAMALLVQRRKLSWCCSKNEAVP
jgi:hypothetical protein